MSKVRLKQINGGTIAGHLITSSAGVVSSLKHNLGASADPSATDDSASDYGVGSVWINTTADRYYVCVDATASSAVWLLLGNKVIDIGPLADRDSSGVSTLTKAEVDNTIVLIDSSSALQTVNLPTMTSEDNGCKVYIKREGASFVDVTPGGSNTLDGSTGYRIEQDLHSITLVFVWGSGPGDWKNV